MIAVNNLRCERAVDPIGIGFAAPRLSWHIAAGDETDVVQTAAQVEVGDAHGVVWDTGRVDGRDQQVRYAGPALGSRATCWWRARVWTSTGDSDWSERATFETGLLEATDWSAQMITASASSPVVRFSTSFDLDAAVETARIHLTAHGAGVMSINGSRVGDEVLAPGWTSYHHRLAARTHDVTELVRVGSNEIEALVAPAWFSGRFGLTGKTGTYGSHVGLLAQLEILLTTGETVVTATDGSWVATSTPFRLAEIYDGETYDATSQGERDLVAVTVVELDPSILFEPTVQPVRRIEAIEPVSRTIVGDNVSQLDFGQNVVGFMRIAASDPKSGTEIVMRHAELLGGDGRLYTQPLRSAKATDTYVARGDEIETYEPTFTFHGFRFAEITGIDANQIDAEAVVVHSDLERIGTFACSDPLIQQLHSNVVWGMRGNFVSVPTDCPQRDERLGWTGDAQVFSPTACFLYDCEAFFSDWLADLRADQHTSGCVPPVIPDTHLGLGDGAAGWGDAATVVPWVVFENYGDDSVLRDSLASMTAWADYVFERLDDMQRWRRDFQFGDWLDPDAPTAEPWRAKAKFDLVASAYAVRSTDLVACSARVLKRDDVAARYEERAQMLRESWWTSYSEHASTTQTGCALAIEFGLAPDDTESQRLGDALVQLIRDADDHLATGFLGTPNLLPALTSTGHLDVAYDVLLQQTCPSWLYQVLAGATTIWERWDALRPDGSVPNEGLGGAGAGMVSYNHYAYGAVADWLHRTVAGLAPDPDDPGYHHVIVRPQPGGGMTHASASLETRYGTTAVAWRIEDATFTLDVDLPPNATATVTLPNGDVTRMGSGKRTFSCVA